LSLLSYPFLRKGIKALALVGGLPDKFLIGSE
jgi:hypothetical protein